MKDYSVINNYTGEILMDIGEAQLQRANKLLRAAQRQDHKKPLKLTKRLGLHRLAQLHADQRDRRVRYGDHRHHPTGITKRRTYKKRPRESYTVRARHHTPNPLVDLALAFIATLCLWVGITVLRREF